jgi:uncharacterized protein YjbI with pentapeptide repeats
MARTIKKYSRDVYGKHNYKKNTFKIKVISWLIENKSSFFFISAFFSGLILLFIDVLTGDIYKKEFWENVLVEAHGMYMDIILFGIIFTLYEKFTSGHNSIQELRQEIDDYREWADSEARFRILGCIRRLLKLGVNDIDLSNCNLRGTDFSLSDLRSANLAYGSFYLSNFSHAKLTGSTITSSNFEASIFDQADLKGLDFYQVNLSKTSLRRANLEGAILQNAILDEVDLRLANLKNINWQGVTLIKANLSGSDLRGINFGFVNILASDLKGADLRGANFEGSNLKNTQVTGAKVSNENELDLLRIALGKNLQYYLVDKLNENYLEIF